MTKPIRVMLVDDHRSVLWGLEKLIDGEKPRMEVCAKAASCAAAVELAAETKPDVVLLDLDLAGENGADIIADLIRNRHTRVLILTGASDVRVRDEAILRGAYGLVHKAEPAENILKAIEKVNEGEIWLDRAATGRIFVEFSRKGAADQADPEQQKIASLTARERQVVIEITSNPGAPAKVIAEQLHISEHTLRNHLTPIYEKLGVANRLELFVYADKHKLRESQSQKNVNA